MKKLFYAMSATLIATIPMAAPATSATSTAAAVQFYEPPPPDPSHKFRKPARNAIIYYNEYGSEQGYDVEYCDGTTESVRDGPGRRIVFSRYYEWMCFGDPDPFGGY